MTFSSRFLKIASKTQSGIHSASNVMVYIAAFALFGMMMVTVGDVVGRFVFNKPITGAFELVGFLMVWAGTWGMAYCQVKKGHIRVDFLLQRFSKRGQAFLTFAAYLIGLLAFSLLTWRVILRAEYFLNLTRGNATDTLGIPIFPFVVLLAIGTGMVALVLLIDLLHTIAEVKGK